MFLRTGKIFRNVLFTAFAVVAIIYMGNSYISYQREYGSSSISVIPSGIKIGIWIIVGIVLLKEILPKRKR